MQYTAREGTHVDRVAAGTAALIPMPESQHFSQSIKMLTQRLSVPLYATARIGAVPAAARNSRCDVVARYPLFTQRRTSQMYRAAALWYRPLQATKNIQAIIVGAGPVVRSSSLVHLEMLPLPGDLLNAGSNLFRA